MAAGILVTTVRFGAFVQQENVRGGFGLYRFQTTDSDRRRHDALYQLIAMVPPKAKIVSSENIVPHVSSRPDAYTLRTGLFDAEYLLFEFPVRGDEANFVREALANDAFGVVAIREPFALVRRGHATAENAALRARLGF
jgi:hypothetical protein